MALPELAVSKAEYRRILDEAAEYIIDNGDMPQFQDIAARAYLGLEDGEDDVALSSWSNGEKARRLYRKLVRVESRMHDYIGRDLAKAVAKRLDTKLKAREARAAARRRAA